MKIINQDGEVLICSRIRILFDEGQAEISESPLWDILQENGRIRLKEPTKKIHYDLNNKDSQNHYELCHGIAKYALDKYPSLFTDMMLECDSSGKGMSTLANQRIEEAFKEYMKLHDDKNTNSN